MADPTNREAPSSRLSTGGGAITARSEIPEADVPVEEALPPGSGPSDLWPSEQLLSDAVGRLMEFWGFKRHMGRIWTVLYLSDEPLGATELRDKLQLSAGSVSMAMNDLLRWGVVKKIWVHGQRRDYFVAESNLWKMVSRVFRERELVEIVEAIGAMEGAIASLQARLTARDPAVRARAETQVARIERLLELARLGRRLIEGLLETARLDAIPLTKFLLGARRP